MIIHYKIIKDMMNKVVYFYLDFDVGKNRGICAPYFGATANNLTLIQIMIYFYKGFRLKKDLY